jgi:excisionase family DNA binding protein
MRSITMEMTHNQAYRLGSMSRRALRARCHPRWPDEEPTLKFVELLNEWLGMLVQLKGKPLCGSVQALRDAADRERQNRSAHEWHSIREKVARHLEAMGEDVVPPVPPEPPASAPADTYEMARDQAEDAEDCPAVRQALGPGLEGAYELGQLVARCMYADAAELTTQRVADLVKSLASEQWLTGSLSTAASAEPLHRTVMNRITELDRLLSALPWPASASGSDNEAASDSPYLTVPEAAKLLRIGEETVERMIANGELPAVELTGRGTLGGRRLKRIMRESLDAFMKERQTKKVDDKTPRRKRPKPGGRDYFA